ncbi:phage major capsid protein [Ammonicoccus fulvus]|uniref:Phage major capsid protein n=1 Tax=Ammonicoccus fulvus TaxID=3138240 RepID=A0ABZ3FNN2_9ACTN
MALSAQTTTAAAGSVAAPELTAEQVHKVLIQPLEQASTFLSSGVRIIESAGPVRLPKAPTSVAADLTFVGENELIPEVDPEFDELSLMPSTMKSIKVLTRFSNELARQSIISLDQALKDRLVADVAARVDAQFLGAGGDGTTTPRGLFGFTGTQSVDAAGPLTLDVVLEALGKLVKAYVPSTGLKLFVGADDYLGIRGTKDTTGRYILSPENQSGLASQLLGITPVLTDRIPTGKAALVSPGHIVVVRDASPSIRVLDQTYGDYDQQAIRITSRWDAAPTNPDAVVIISGITAAP